MSNPTEPYDDDLPAEIDFSQGRRGQFHRPQTRLNLPVYLEAEVEAIWPPAPRPGVSMSANSSTSC